MSQDAERVRPAGRGRPPMTDRRRERQRLEISREAVRLFREQGVAATSGEQIARAVGFSARTLWRYFATKESCVEPLLTVSIDGFIAVLRSWPRDRALLEHLEAEYRAEERSGDSAAVLDVVRMTRDEPGVRAVWLLVHQRAERAFAEAVAARTGRDAGDLEVRVHAAAVNTAVRIAAEDHAWGAVDADGGGARSRLIRAVQVAVHGLPAPGYAVADEPGARRETGAGDGR